MNELPVVEVFTEGDINLPYNKINYEFIQKISSLTLNHLKLKNISIAVIITDNDFIQQINKEYRDKDYSTDVISFSYRDDFFPEINSEIENIGDIYISIEKAKEQAVEYGHSLENEIKKLIIHGIVHLAGHDHEGPGSDAEKMFSLENKISEKILL